jgi:hypothetical protein
LTERSPRVVPFEELENRRANRCRHRSCFLFQRFPGLQSINPRMPSALLVPCSRPGLVSRRIEKLPFAGFSVRGASSQSSDVTSSLALGSLLEYWPTPAACCRARALKLNPRELVSSSEEPDSTSLRITSIALVKLHLSCSIAWPR